uniref:FAD-binding domain-containing protein n=1 Tax=Tetradesmus obliquus TaxID=3088 RepID=A0A383WJX5_TETOB|eukprot:jgi/Sobl393_1/17869/SZX77424.1
MQVYEQRPQPADLDDTSPGVGGGVRLEANGLKALTAISRRLAANVMAQGLYAQRVMLHDTDAGTLITHLHQQSPNQLHPSARQPALVVGWSELQQLLLDQLPPDTVQWDATAINYSDSTSGGVTLHVVVKQPQQQGPEGEAPEDEASIQMQQQQQVDTAKDSPQQQQRRRQYRHQKSAPSSATSPFLAASHQDAASLRSPSAPAAAGMNAAADSPPNDAADLTAHPLGQSLALVEEEAPPHAEAAEEEEQAAALQVERVTVQATLLVAADGPLSPIRQQLVGDGLPQFDNTLRWVGRLPGDLMSSIPGDFEAWWLGPGLAFNSHPLSNGDVAWEAQVSSSSLASDGYTWDPASHSLLPLRPVSRSSSPDSLRPHNSSRTDGSQTQQQEQQQQQQQDGASRATNGWTGLQTLLRVSTAAAGGSFDTARGAAAAPAGEGEPQARETGPVKPATAAAAGPGQEGEAGAALHGMQAPTKPSQALLLQLFRAFPAPVRDMIAATPPASLLEAAVLMRPARALPNCLGRGGLVVLGEAAHPLRPSVGQGRAGGAGGGGTHAEAIS